MKRLEIQRIRLPFILLLLSAFLTALSGIPVQAQMQNPKIDNPSEPFSYFAFPTDVIGMMDCREGTEVTPEGYLYTGYGELLFFFGSPPRPVNQRVKTLYRGYFPIIRYSFTHENVRYALTLFAFTTDGNPESPLINFIRIEFENQSQDPRTVYFWTGTRYEAESRYAHGVPDHRFRRPAKASEPGLYEQEGEEFSDDWEYSFAEGMMLRDGKAFYFFPQDIPHSLWITLKTPFSERWKKPVILPTTPVGVVKFEITLKPEEKKALDLKMPYRPITQEEEAFFSIKEADFDDYFQKAVAFWEKIFSQGMKISLPEEKVVHAFNANLAYDLIARDKIGEDYVQKVNEFQYDAFWLRDSAYIVRAYDVAGYHQIAEQCLDFFLKWQREDGNFVSQEGQYDGWGQTLWAIGQHFRLTRDLDFARKFFPAVASAMDWLMEARSKEPLHIMPVTTPGDNELITGHVTGHNFWAMGGIKAAIDLAEGLGKEEEAERFRAEYDDYFQHFMQALSPITEESGGYIPPGLDELGGQDWGNLMAVYPTQILDPSDPLVTKTLEVARSKYREGLMTYGDGRWLHHYLTMKNTETEVVRGEQERALQEFYSILVHTSSTHAGFEFRILPWGDRDFGHNLSPHGWFAAKFRTLVRNMLIREQANTLHLFSILSPAWIREGEKIEVADAPTDFGMIDFSLELQEEGACLRLNPQFRKAPERIVFHIPWFVEFREASIEGNDRKKIEATNRTLLLPPDTREVHIKWERKPVGAWNYDYFVQEYKEEYRKKYEEFLEKGEGRKK
ncbi:MAG: hypothetical protein ACE5L7_07505 [Candidatus Aminicenantales bacterium]